MRPYRVKDWERIYETHETRKLVALRWVPVPVKLDGDGYTLIMSQPDGPQLFGCWIALVELGAKMIPRGTFVRGDGRPHDGPSIARITRMPVDLVERALTFFFEDLDWLEIAELPVGAAPLLPLQPGTPGESPDVPGKTTGRREGNRMEGKGREGREGEAAPPPGTPAPAEGSSSSGSEKTGSGFLPPTLDEMVEYAAELHKEGWTVIELGMVNKFHDHRTALGWKTSAGTEVTDWRADFRKWARSENDHRARNAGPRHVSRGRR